ncbi:HAD domain-containing protein [Lacisediminimonas sp.]|uniref:HAD domain-containing protein n=1 Tax=Lacisediminimonas sp. TaxID=3060582 RepID=UPI002723C200|nr:HAD domain-containing protein [Lacisediminimonas sp.]MDO8301296.1 HAD domain-containing protein [Lacisediminimonas sp.]
MRENEQARISLSGVLSKLSHFERVIRNCDFGIAISSAWRIDHSIAQLRAYFSHDISARIIDITPNFHVAGFDLDYCYVREQEIKACCAKRDTNTNRG